jgi:hypothetical protein
MTTKHACSRCGSELVPAANDVPATLEEVRAAFVAGGKLTYNPFSVPRTCTLCHEILCPQCVGASQQTMARRLGLDKMRPDEAQKHYHLFYDCDKCYPQRLTRRVFKVET